MNKLRQNGVALLAISRQQVCLNLAAWKQLLITPFVSTALYLIVFGEMLGDRVGPMADHDYSSFIAPGLIMMAIFVNSFSGTGSAFVMAKSSKQINDLLITPISLSIVLVGYVVGGVVRGLMVGAALTLIVLLFIQVQPHDPLIALLAALVIAVFFSLAGLLNAVLTKDPTQAGWLPVFLLSPLTYLGGIFFTIDMLPRTWQTVATYNPMLYMVNLFRFGMIGSSDIEIELALLWILGTIALLFITNLALLRRGYDLRT